MKRRLMMILAALTLASCGGGSDDGLTWDDFKDKYPPGWTPAQACATTQPPPAEFCQAYPVERR